MAQMFLDATTKPTSPDKDGQPRSAAGEFIRLAKGLEQDMRQE